MITIHLRTLAAALLAAAALPSAAQNRPAVDVERLWLDPSARGSLVLGSGEVLDRGTVRGFAALHYERTPLVLTDGGDLRGRGLFWQRSSQGQVVSNRTALELGFAAAIAPRFELLGRLPLVIGQNGEGSETGGLAVSDAGLSTPSFGVRVALLSRREGAPNAAAIAVEAAPPWNNNFNFGGEKGWRIAPRLEAARTMGDAVAILNVGGILRTKDVELTNGEKLSHELTAGVGYATLTGPLRYEGTVRGWFNLDGLSQGMELLGGVRFQGPGGELFLLAGPGFMESPGTPTFRVLLGGAFATGKPAAPAAPAAAAAAAPPPDPCAPGNAHTPEQCPALDDDGDGIANGQDRCPTEKGIAETQGCPPKDTDGDGVPDHADRCPDVKGLPDFQGCPPPDRDHDGIPDAEDRCPEQPGVPANQGCPPERAEIKAGKIEVKQKVFFDSGKATIQPRSFALLDDVAALLVANAAVGPIRIEGHTDNTGNAEKNRTLSQERAETVKAYLVQKGVDAARLEAAGLGADKPLADNKTAAGREQNRRVEFVIVGVPQG
jgi:OmpA-OmpF porin, OOP family